MLLERYDCVFEGRILDGRDLEQVKRGLSKLMSVRVERIDILFSGEPVTLKRRIDRQTALKYGQAFQSVGAVLKIVESEGAGLEATGGSLAVKDRQKVEPGVLFKTPRSERPNGPLFVLKYRAYKVILRTILFSFVFFMFGVIACVPEIRGAGPMGLLVTLFCASLSCGGTVMLIDLCLFKEIRLHHDRIIKIWRLLGEAEVILARARLSGMRLIFGSSKAIADRETNRFLTIVKGVFYHEDMADSEDIDRLNGLLAHLSGRKVEEFQRWGGVHMETLIKGEEE